MLADGFTTRWPARHTIRTTTACTAACAPGAGRLAALASSGAIPDLGDYRVILEPTERSSGRSTDFAVERSGDVFSSAARRIDPQSRI
jgi:hypothetical protein